MRRDSTIRSAAKMRSSRWRGSGSVWEIQTEGARGSSSSYRLARGFGFGVTSLVTLAVVASVFLLASLLILAVLVSRAINALAAT